LPEKRDIKRVVLGGELALADDQVCTCRRAGVASSGIAAGARL
jgi:hypothetical protein